MESVKSLNQSLRSFILLETARAKQKGIEHDMCKTAWLDGWGGSVVAADFLVIVGKSIVQLQLEGKERQHLRGKSSRESNNIKGGGDNYNNENVMKDQQAEAIFKMISKIREYSNLKKGDRLKELQEKISLSESQLQSCDTRKQEISAELNKSKDLIRNQDQVKRNIDNLNYKKMKVEVDELTHEIETLE
ncbi:hypothetical protein Fmac_024288 [Flemingia macrophylla]|uniref:Uncharacterized protein n=1 Tax=Flemingia macrophylla TaxID=520843 RepID=A0ABD1LNX9_9FABA